VNPHTTVLPLAQKQIATSVVSAALLLTVLGVLGGCRRQAGAVANGDNKSAQSAGNPANNGIKTAQQVQTAASDDIKFLVPGRSVTAVFTTKSRSLIVKAAETNLRAAYTWEPGQQPKLLVQGNGLEITRLSDDSFAAWYSDSDEQTFAVTFNAQQLTSPIIALPTFSGWGGCEGNDALLVCLGNRPGMSPDDVDEMGFTAVLVVDLAARKTTWFDVGHRTHYRLDASRKLIYVSDHYAHDRVVEIFNLKGETLGPSDESHLQATSPSGRFIQSLPEHGDEGWQIYELASKQQLFAFNGGAACNGGAICKTGDHNDSYWNPVMDGQFAVVRDSGKPYGKGSSCDVYQASPPHLVKSFPCTSLIEYDWSRDGKALITLEYDGGSYHIENVN
jgi:hypothetical protein